MVRKQPPELRNSGGQFLFLFKYTYMYEETKLLFVAKYLVIKEMSGTRKVLDIFLCLV